MWHSASISHTASFTAISKQWLVQCQTIKSGYIFYKVPCNTSGLPSVLEALSQPSEIQFHNTNSSLNPLLFILLRNFSTIEVARVLSNSFKSKTKLLSSVDKHAVVCATENLWQETFFLLVYCFFVSPYSLTEPSTHLFPSFRPDVFIGSSFPTDLHVEQPSPFC